jgi:hypothetical protein
MGLGLPDDGRQFETLSLKVLHPSGQKQITAGRPSTERRLAPDLNAGQYCEVSAAGAYRPKIQFLTVRSFAPVQLATNFAREFRSFSSDFNASAIFIVNARSSRLNLGLPPLRHFGKDLTFSSSSPGSVRNRRCSQRQLSFRIFRDLEAQRQIDISV